MSVLHLDLILKPRRKLAIFIGDIPKSFSVGLGGPGLSWRTLTIAEAAPANASVRLSFFGLVTLEPVIREDLRNFHADQT